MGILDLFSRKKKEQISIPSQPPLGLLDIPSAKEFSPSFFNEKKDKMPLPPPIIPNIEGKITLQPASPQPLQQPKTQWMPPIPSQKKSQEKTEKQLPPLPKDLTMEELDIPLPNFEEPSGFKDPAKLADSEKTYLEKAHLEKKQEMLLFPEIPSEFPEHEEALPEINKETEYPKYGPSSPDYSEPEHPEIPMPTEIPDLMPQEPAQESQESYSSESAQFKWPAAEPPAKKLMLKTGNIFIASPDITLIHHKLDEIKGIVKLSKANEKMIGFKNKEDSCVNAIKNSLESIQRKLMYIDKDLFEKQEA